MVKDIEVKNTLIKNELNNIILVLAGHASKEVVLRFFSTKATLPPVKLLR